MTGARTDKDPPPTGLDPGAAALIEDWITIWQSELAAMILDRESQDTLLRLVDGWAVQATAALALLGAPHDPSGPAGTDAPSGPAAVAAAPDGTRALVEQLRARIDELERRLAGPRPGDAA